MTEIISLKYRTFGKGIGPRPIKMEIPGWGGDKLPPEDGNPPQPWHCTPFVQGSTYGLELLYPFEAETRISLQDGKLIVEGDFSQDGILDEPPFKTFAEGHYGFTSSLDLLPPEDYCIRVEPHPRFFTDDTGTVAALVPGHIQRFWSRIFFVVFKAPIEGQTHIFRHLEPYGQVLVLPRKVSYNIQEMTEEENQKRIARDSAISKCGQYISKKAWRDYKGNVFDDKYKQLASAYHRNGDEGVQELFEKASKKLGEQSSACPFKRKLFKVSRESVQNQKKKNQEEVPDVGLPSAVQETEISSHLVQESEADRGTK